MAVVLCRCEFLLSNVPMYIVRNLYAYKIQEINYSCFWGRTISESESKTGKVSKNCSHKVGWYTLITLGRIRPSRVMLS
jgi:hypothetical protein